MKAIRDINPSCEISDEACVELRVSEKQTKHGETCRVDFHNLVAGLQYVRASSYLANHRSYIRKHTHTKSR